MAAPPFIDSNILLYAGSHAPEDAAKKHHAGQLLASLDFCLSSQVIQEYISNALRKKALGISQDQIEAVIQCLADVTVLPVTYELIVQAWQLRRRFQVSHWDATIIAAAQALGCKTLYSEDLSHGQDFDGVRVVNRFVVQPSDIIL
jgi:predicted nucleic acid-binding protein